jgi:hypothetical protein
MESLFATKPVSADFFFLQQSKFFSIFQMSGANYLAMKLLAKYDFLYACYFTEDLDVESANAMVAMGEQYLSPQHAQSLGHNFVDYVS